MDTLFYYRLMRAVERSLAAAGRGSFRLSYADGEWFTPRWLFDYLDTQETCAVPLVWGGRAMAAFDCLRRRFDGAYDDRMVAWTDGFSLAQVKEVWVSACLEAIRDGTDLTAEAAHRAVRRLRGQREAVDRDFASTKPMGFQM